jgi:hypothetical protein
MTVIAWDGKMLAADKASTSSGYLGTVTKIYRVPGGIVGFSGDADKAMDLLEWFRKGRHAEHYPAGQKEGGADALFIDAEGRVFMFDKTHNATMREEKFVAMGCGRDYALAVMYLGHDARRAVEVACALDNGCGKGIDTLELE